MLISRVGPIVRPDDHEIAGLHEAGRASDSLLEVAEHAQAVSGHAGKDGIAVVLADDRARGAGDPVTDRAALAQDDIHATFGEVVGNARAGHSAADDHRVGRLCHCGLSG